jgi:hypothetical protein
MKTQSAQKKYTWLAMAFGLALLVAGCATEVGNHTFLKQSYPPKLETFQVEVFTNGLPTRAFERVAILDAHCESQWFATPNLEQDGLPMLIKQARAAGCDAIIEVKETKLAENWTLETKVKQYTAVGIVYK